MLPHVGPLELLVLLALVLVVIGPRRLPEVARTAGRLMGELRRTTFELRQTLESELRAEERARWRAEAETKREAQTESSQDLKTADEARRPAVPLPKIRAAEGTQPSVESVREISEEPPENLEGKTDGLDKPDLDAPGDA